MSIMKNAGQWAVNKEWTDRDLEEAKISIFQAVDAPKAVNEEGMARFLSGVTEEMRQKKREQLLDVTKAQVQEVANKYLVEAVKKGDERISFLGEKKPWVDSSWSVQEMNVSEAEEV